MKKLVIFGATSAIAIGTARAAASAGCELILCARDADKLSALADDVRIRGAKSVVELIADLSDSSLHNRLLEDIAKIDPDYDTVLIAYGTLGDQSECEQSFEATWKEFQTNFLSVVSLLTPIANRFEEQKRGNIAVITSVAGDRGRQSNYVYGAAKGGLSIFLAGLRNRLSAVGVGVLTIKPGFVDTPMTASIPKNALFANPDVVGKGIYHAMLKRKDVIYIPWYWRIVMGIVCSIPEGLFKYQRKI